MGRRTLGAAFVAAAFLLNSSADAQPLVATYTGVLWGTEDAFTATFHYDTRDLIPSAGNSDFLDARTGTMQWATYADPFRTLTFTPPAAFSKGEYDSVVYDANGEGGVAEIDTVHEYSISTRSGYLSLSFGGVGDFGLVTFGTDGTDYANLDPRFFTLSKEALSAVSPVPLPPGAPLFGGALLLVGVLGRAGFRTAGRPAP